MNINNISNQTFEGNVIFSEKLTKPMIEYSNKILDYPYLGKTARERIATKNYDINIWGQATKKTINPKIRFSSEFKILKDKKVYYPKTIIRVFSEKEISIRNSVKDGAENLNLFLLNFEIYRDKFDFAYNTFGEKIQAYLKKIFNIRK